MNSSAHSALALLLPAPLEHRGAEYWLRATVMDYLLVMLNWLLVDLTWSRFGSFSFAQFPIVVTPTPSITAPTLLGVAFLHGALITLLSYTEGLNQPFASPRQQARTLVKAIFWATGLLSAALQLQGAPTRMMLPLGSAAVLSFGALLGWRCFERERSQRAKSPAGARNVLIVGANDCGQRVANYLQQHPESERVVCGFLDEWKPLGDGVIGRMRDLPKLSRTCFVDEIILTAPQDRSSALRILRDAQRLQLDVKLVPDLFGYEPLTELERVGEFSLIPLHEVRLPVFALLLKRALDVVFAGMAVLILAAVFAVIALLIKLDSPGPVIYAAPRAGRKGRSFLCFKFRTMVRNADDLKDQLRTRNQRDGPFFKIAGDPRITRVGAFLRRYSLDELPQLWNVLIGDMSMVGPRPHPLDDFSAYAPEHLPRLDVTPGITGLWQVTARRDPSFQTGLELDLEYIQRWSVALDFRILLKTALVVLRGNGD